MSSTSQNVWKVFFSKYNLAKSANSTRWIDLARQQRPPLLDVRLFALANYEAEKGEPLVCGEENHESCVGMVARKSFGFGYQCFAADRDQLEVQLGRLGVELLMSGNGNRQYLRTIHRLSGAVFLKAAQRAKNIPIDKWVVGDDLNHVIAEATRRYRNQGEDDGNGLVLDVRDFFRRMRERYHRYNEPPSLETCIREEPQLSRPMMKRVLDVLFPSKENDDPEAAYETIPVFLLGNRGLPVCGFPPRQLPVFDVADAVQTIRISFRRGACESVAAIFRRNANGWTMDRNAKVEQGVPIAEVRQIVRQDFGGDRKLLGAPIDLTPGCLASPDSSHLLLRECGGRLRAIDPSESVSAGARIFTVWLHDYAPLPIMADREAAEPTEVFLEHDGSFRVPTEATCLRIGNCEYPVATQADTWLDAASAFGRDKGGARILDGGARLFFTKGTYPFSDAFLDAESLCAQYRKSDGATVRVESWLNPPSEILWDRGRCDFFDAATGNVVASRAVTFLPEIDDTGLVAVFDLDKDYAVSISAADEKNEQTIPRATDGKVTDHVVFSLHGFRFRYPVKRRGVLVKVEGSGDNPMPLHTDGWVKLAEDDFEAAVFSAELTDGESSLAVVSPDGESRPFPGKKRFSGYDLLSCANDSCLGEWRFFSTASSLGGIRVFSPDRTPWDGLSGHPVSHGREEDDLVVKFWIARRWRAKQLSLVYLPAHRQDKKPEVCSCESASVSFVNANGRLGAIMRIGDFYDTEKTDIDWGAGLLCFVAFQQGARLHAVSSGFFLPRPGNLEPWSVSPQEDPYGLRKAMAECDLDAIDRIMMSENEGCRDYIRTFEKETYNALYSLGHENMRYFHAYYSRCKMSGGNGYEPSGYFFMAGWLVEERMKEIVLDQGWPRLKMGENYKGMWSPLLAIYSDRFVKEWKIVAGNMRDQATRADRHAWVSSHTFNEDNLKPLGARMARIIDETERRFNATHADFTPRKYDPTYSIENGTPPFEGKSASDLEECLSRLAKWIVEWRKNPSCIGAQPLRDLLLAVERIDEAIMNEIASEVRPLFTLTDRIAMKSWLLS